MKLIHLNLIHLRVVEQITLEEFTKGVAKHKNIEERGKSKKITTGTSAQSTIRIAAYYLIVFGYNLSFTTKAQVTRKCTSVSVGKKEGGAKKKSRFGFKKKSPAKAEAAILEECWDKVIAGIELIAMV